MSEDIQAVLKKVKKLLGLARGRANAEESASAAAKAQELIDKYHLELSDVEAKAEEEAPIGYSSLNKPSKRVVVWQTKLAMVIARANGCKAFILGDPHPVDRNKTINSSITVLGTKENVMLVHYLFSYLSREINRLTAKAVREKSIGDYYVSLHPKKYGEA